MGSATTGEKEKYGTEDYKQFRNEEDSEDLEEKAEIRKNKDSKCPPTDGFKFIVAGCVLFALSLTIGVIIDTFTKKQATGHGTVASDSKQCSDIGIEILLKGGTAVDSAISSMICLAVVKPGSTGLTSGGYMLLHTPAGKDVTIDFQFVAPSFTTQDMFKKDKSKAEKGGLSVAVPGLLKGLAAAHSKYGKLDWSSLIKPTIELLKNGIRVEQDTVDEITKSLPDFSDEMKKLITPGGKIPKVGDNIKFGNISGILEKISAKGPDAFYTGNIAKSIVDIIKANGGNLTEKDLKNYQAIETGTYNTEFKGYKVISTPAPSSGAIVLAAMNLVNQLKLSANDQKTTLNFHYLVEVFKFVFAERAKIGDPNFDKNVTEIVKEILSVEKAVELAKKVSKNQTYPVSYYGPFLSSAITKGTANVVVLGTNGDLVSVISTIGSSFGSKLMTDSGLILNNGMSSFSAPGFPDKDGIPPSEANYIEAGKRPLSAAAPVIAFNKLKPCSNQYVVGSSGGAKSITATIQVLVDLLKYESSGINAVNKARVHSQLQPDTVLAEGKRFHQDGLSNVLTELKSIGYKLDSSKERLGAVNLISQKNKHIIPVSDERKYGGTGQF